MEMFLVALIFVVIAMSKNAICFFRAWRKRREARAKEQRKIRTLLFNSRKLGWLSQWEYERRERREAKAARIARMLNKSAGLGGAL